MRLVCLHAYKCLTLKGMEGVGWHVTVVTLNHLLSGTHMIYTRRQTQTLAMITGPTTILNC